MILTLTLCFFPQMFFFMKRFFFFNHCHLLVPRLLLLSFLQQSHLCLFIIITTLLILHLSQIQCPLLPLHYLQFQLTPFHCQPHLIEGLPEHANTLPIFKTTSATLPTKGLLNQGSFPPIPPSAATGIAGLRSDCYTLTIFIIINCLLPISLCSFHIICF